MRILLTNDDGIYAPGLAAVYAVLSQAHKITVVAPETEQSATGHAITLAEPIRVQRLQHPNFKGWAITGTPADSVKLAINKLLELPPEMIVSGINLGANVGVSVLYSGTVSAAREGAIFGIPSIALSLAYTPSTYNNPDFSFAASFTTHLIECYHLLNIPSNVVLNVNFPPLPRDKIKGVRFIRQSDVRLKEYFHNYTNPRGNFYFWQGIELTKQKDDLSPTDLLALLTGYITITPIKHDLTHEEVLNRLTQIHLDLPSCS